MKCIYQKTWVIKVDKIKLSMYIDNKHSIMIHLATHIRNSI